MAKVFNTAGVKEFCALLNAWDRFSDYSDMASVRRRGDDQWAEIKSWFTVDSRFSQVMTIWCRYADGGRTPEGKTTATKAIDALL